MAIQKPLADTRIILLRALEQGKEWALPLEQLGAQVILLPLITFKPIQESLNRITAPFLSPYTLLFFTSVNGVRFALQEGRGALFKDKKICAVGPKTAATLVEHGVEPTLIAEQHDSEGLLKALPEKLAGEKALLLIAEESRELLPEQLKKRGAQVTELKIYRTLPIVPTHLPLQEGDWVLFTSPSVVKQFFKEVYHKQKITVFCMGRVTEAELLKYYQGEIIVSQQATLESLTQAMIRRVNEIPHH